MSKILLHMGWQVSGDPGKSITYLKNRIYLENVLVIICSGNAPAKYSYKALALRSIRWVQLISAAILLCICATAWCASDFEYGPYNAHFLSDGAGLCKDLDPAESALSADSTWTMYLWFHQAGKDLGTTLLAGIGNPLDDDSRFLGLEQGHPMLRFGAGNQLVSPVSLNPEQWHLLAAIFDGKLIHIYADGYEVSSGVLLRASVKPQLQIGPANLPNDGGWKHFGGEIIGLTLSRRAFIDSEMWQLYKRRPDFSLPLLEEGSQSWPVQTHGQAGYSGPQDPSLMPHSNSVLQKALPSPLHVQASQMLEENSGSEWALSHGWLLAAAPDVAASPEKISQPDFSGAKWIAATVPGTVLTSMINQGIYPDPDFGLNNLAIPEMLNKQQYWYRKVFVIPSSVRGRHIILTFNGINYSAEVWLNGHFVGPVRGAFIRGNFDITSLVNQSGKNALAVRISPPPHPGIPQEQSLKGGPGANGGMMALDGPTFVATEGWDWIPAIRDRDTGIWQSVVLRSIGNIDIGDPQVITRLPLPDTSSAEVVLNIPLKNADTATRMVQLNGSFEGVSIRKSLRLAPGDTSIHLTSAEFPQLKVRQPRLWWPNGYGKPELYHLKISISDGGTVSAQKELTFGIREVSYEVSLFDSAGKLRRVEVLPSEALKSPDLLVNVTHEGIRQTASGWAASLTVAGERSLAVKTIPAGGLNDLVIKVNGIRIAARGGNWGMDDSRKRVSRQRLEPYFRLHRDAHLNIIRNWVGQNSEEAFYQLADEYGLMVWNDFWISTQNYNLEPEDHELFLQNAADVVARFRNHPSIVIWCGRNEGVPPPAINQGLIDLLREEDGTRYYMPSSNQINLRGSGPYNYQLPEQYFGKMDEGFAVEIGTPSFSTLESFQTSIGRSDQWPISDAWAYHDWHQSAGGDVHPFMEHMERQFGAPTGLEDFERKAQMMNYVDHRAIFESFNNNLWSPNSGRLLWMTQPAWPSNNWQIMNSDYDTGAAYYGVKKACEPLHVQFNPQDHTVSVINTTTLAEGPLKVVARVYSLSNRILLEQQATITAEANARLNVFSVNLTPALYTDGPVIIRLEMTEQGKAVSDNFYWSALHEEDYRKLDALGSANIHVSLSLLRDGDEPTVRVQLSNEGDIPALAVKLTPLKSGTSLRILPAYLSDNYFSMLPHEKKVVTIRLPAHYSEEGVVDVGVRGWNLPEVRIAGN